MTSPWWRDTQNVHRFVCDLLSAQIAELRPGGGASLPQPWAPETLLEADLGADSLERLQLATAFGEAIHLHNSGIDDALLAKYSVGEWVSVAAAALDRFSAELTFRTSGSTGHPKWCTHPLVELKAEVDLLAQIIGARRRIISAVPGHHIYGFLFTMLLPGRLNVEVIDVRQNSPSRLASVLEAGDVVIGHPEFWAAFVRSVPHVRADIIGVTSTAPCPAHVAQGVVDSGITRFIEVYGSSETTGIGWRDDSRTAYELFDYWSRGTTDSQLVRHLASGAQCEVVPPDRLEWDDARHLRPAGRTEGAVQVGGNNVFPARISELLRSHPGVADAAVRLMLPVEGSRLKAFIVPRDLAADSASLRAQLRTFADSHLTPAERPKAFTFGAELPASALGKPADWRLSEPANDDIAPSF